MEQKRKYSYLITLICFFAFSQLTMNNQVLAATAERGEEVYKPQQSPQPKQPTNTQKTPEKQEQSAQKSTLQNTATDTKDNQSQEEELFPSSNTNPTEEEDTKNVDDVTKLKDFTRKTPSKRSSTPSKTTLPNNDLPQNTAPLEANPSSLKGPSGIMMSPNDQDKIDKENEIKIEANKLVDVNEKKVEAKKYNGMIWFFAIFVLLLIVIFAFT